MDKTNGLTYVSMPLLYRGHMTRIWQFNCEIVIFEKMAAEAVCFFLLA
jgi:hypothetical protein